MVQDPPADAGGTRAEDSSPGSGRSPEEETAASSRILAWKIQWTGSLVDYALWCHKETDMTEQQSTQTTQILAEGHNFFPQKFLLIKIVYEYQKTYQHANIHN